MGDTAATATLITVLGAGAAAIAVPRQIQLVVRHTGGRGLPGIWTLTLASIAQYIVLVLIGSVVGVTLGVRAGLHSPWLAGLASANPASGAPLRQLTAAVSVTLVVFVPFTALYYGVFRRTLPPETVRRTEDLRRGMGLVARVLMGGVVEEIVFRFGVMSLIAWLTISVAGAPEAIGMWTAIVIAGVLFGLAHLPGGAAIGIPITAPLVTMAISLNLLVALGFGWLFWTHGLLAAIASHALVHVLWFPLDHVVKPPE